MYLAVMWLYYGQCMIYKSTMENHVYDFFFVPFMIIGETTNFSEIAGSTATPNTFDSTEIPRILKILYLPHQ